MDTTQTLKVGYAWFVLPNVKPASIITTHALHAKIWSEEVLLLIHTYLEALA